MKVIDQKWDVLADLLRQEIEGYGRLFWMLNEQHENLIKHNIEGVSGTTESMSRHAAVLDALRNRRESLVKELWKGSGQGKDLVSVKELMRLAPGASSPMFEELLEEVSRLVIQSRKKLQHNQILLNMVSVLQYSRFNGDESGVV